MTDPTVLPQDLLPSSRKLAKLTAIALLVAAVLLVTVVLPAEYGVDPTGLGTRLGLTALSTGTASTGNAETPATRVAESSLEPSAGSPLTAVWKSPTPYRNDVQTVTLAPNQGIEVKARMKAGERFMFSWKAEGGAVSVDMHGEKLQAAQDEFTSYWKGRDQTEAHGQFQAPFDGTHGWYWRNRGQTPVTITVQTSGFYEKLYRL
ncbi:hypothetical protein [Chitinimonas lacunae]|uniref:Transmembrane anchor protein n=1 Tax=Chitinimonas lacunae TaxID=1963018 RepID=A0ABV8MQW7_9NEIS